MTTPAVPNYSGHRFPAEIISHAVWLYFRFPLSLRMVDELLAARGIMVRPRDGATMRAEVRPSLRQPDPPQAAPVWRHMAPGRSWAPDIHDLPNHGCP